MACSDHLREVTREVTHGDILVVLADLHGEPTGTACTRWMSCSAPARAGEPM
jgi:hypothetical protein